MHGMGCDWQVPGGPGVLDPGKCPEGLVLWTLASARRPWCSGVWALEQLASMRRSVLRSSALWPHPGGYHQRHRDEVPERHGASRYAAFRMGLPWPACGVRDRPEAQHQDQGRRTAHPHVPRMGALLLHCRLTGPPASMCTGAPALHGHRCSCPGCCSASGAPRKVRWSLAELAPAPGVAFVPPAPRTACRCWPWASRRTTRSAGAL